MDKRSAGSGCNSIGKETSEEEGSEVSMLECAICTKEIAERPDVVNGELLCEECYAENKEVIKSE